MPLRCGIVGLPNVGKSTLFNALTLSQVSSDNYPFCTIEPNIGIVNVPDQRLEKIAKIVNPKDIIPVSIEFIDIAGLVAGASKGQGLGNKFLANIREVDAIIHVVRCFQDQNVVHMAGSVDPIRDIDIINTELCLSDLATVEKAIIKNQKIANIGNQDAKKALVVFEKVEDFLNQGQPIRNIPLAQPEKDILKPLCLLTIKPNLYLANVAEDGFTNNPWLDQINSYAKVDNSLVLSICTVLESSLLNLDYQSKIELLKEIGMNEPGLNRLAKTAYKLLSLGKFFTAGDKAARAWPFILGSNAKQCAKVIHNDFATGFIRAEIISFDDYLKFNGENGAKAAGKMRLESKEYLVQDGDVIYFRFNV